MVLKVFSKGDFLGLLICCSQKNSDQETLKIPFVAISFKSNLRMTGLDVWKIEIGGRGPQKIIGNICTVFRKHKETPITP